MDDSLEPDIQEVIAFGAKHARAIGAAYQTARSELGFELPLERFTVHLYEAVEADLGAPPDSAPRRIPRILAALESTDIYLVAAAIAGLPAAHAALDRWHGPQLRATLDFSAEPGQQDAWASVLGRYRGLSTLSNWLRCLAASTSAGPPPAVPMPPPARDPDTQRLFEFVPRLALDGMDPRRRLALLASILGVPTAADSAVVTEAGGNKQLARLCDRLGEAVQSEVGVRLARRGRDRKTRTVLVGASTGKERLQAAAILRLHEPRTEPCPDLNLLAAGSEGRGPDPEGVAAHASRCWPCLQAALAVTTPPVREPARNPLVDAALLALVLVAVALGGLWVWRSWPAPVLPQASLGEPATASSRDPEPIAMSGQVSSPTPAPGRAASKPGPPPPTRPEVTAFRTEPPPPFRSPAVERPARPTPAPRRLLADIKPAGQTRFSTPPAVAAAPVERILAPPAPVASPATTVRTTPPPAAVATPVARATPGAAWRSASLRRARSQSRAAQIVNQAVNRYRPGDEVRTITFLEQALALEPDLVEAHYNCAVLLERLGVRERAARHWRRYVDGAPTGPEAVLIPQGSR